MPLDTLIERGIAGGNAVTTINKNKDGELPGWSIQVDEVSAGVYRVVGIDEAGRRFEATGTNPDALLDECKRYAARFNHPTDTSH